MKVQNRKKIRNTGRFGTIRFKSGLHTEPERDPVRIDR